MKKFELTKFSGDFAEIVKNRYVEKYADDALQLLEDFKKIEQAYKIYSGWIKELEKGNIEVVQIYKKKRNKLETVEGFEIDDDPDEE